MSSQSSENLPDPSDRSALYSALGWLGAFALFVLIVFIAYIPNRAVDAREHEARLRHEIRADVDARQQRLATNYDWINRDAGVVRLPIDRAMELTVRELRAKASEEGRAP